MKGKQLLVPGGDNLKRPIPAPAVTLSQQLHTILRHLKSWESLQTAVSCLVDALLASSS
ncbi:hypothetical protein T03_1056 [Trichinella britovi]|uniref:Uncharacterized protein n=1 Tax=Trichinella britovi TaxID=45882 RepID=A0A0V0YZB5_TRIBR|nr:hypothetical protein T03_1056 [Trichinella britovi]